jgi:hypothetical protein
MTMKTQTPSADFSRIKLAGAKHLYNVEVQHENGECGYIEVEAHNRTFAAIRVEQRGFTARSVNMVG